MYIAIDFDGTIVDHQFPEIGEPVAGAFEYMRLFQEAGAALILWTMRSDTDNAGPVLSDAVNFCLSHGIEFAHVNENPQEWTSSPKAYAHVYIDDAAYGCPLRENPRSGGRQVVDWEIVGPAVLEMIHAKIPQNGKRST